MVSSSVWCAAAHAHAVGVDRVAIERAIYCQFVRDFRPEDANLDSTTRLRSRRRYAGLARRAGLGLGGRGVPSTSVDVRLMMRWRASS